MLIKVSIKKNFTCNASVFFRCKMLPETILGENGRAVVGTDTLVDLHQSDDLVEVHHGVCAE